MNRHYAEPFADQEFEVWYQPQFVYPLAFFWVQKHLFGVTQYGANPPIDFIPLAESNGLIITIGEYVLHQVCLDINHLLNAQLNPIKVGVNVAGPQLFRRSDFVALLEQVLTGTQLPSATLEIEITKPACYRTLSRRGKILEQVQKIGIMVAIDDFGTRLFPRCPISKLSPRSTHSKLTVALSPTYLMMFMTLQSPRAISP